MNNINNEELWNAWIYASCSIFVLSACGLFGVLLIPLAKSIAYQKVLKFLIAVAVGTLSGDALMHLLPHALSSGAATQAHGEHKHNPTTVYICACTFITAVFMYMMENLLPLLRSKCFNTHTHTHSHAHQTGNLNNGASVLTDTEARDINTMLNEAREDQKTNSQPLTPLAFMVVIGDGLHNVTDGLAIGAAFAADPVTGMATAVAVLAHELPHELGDFALLLQTGVSMRRAICLNIVSSVLSFVGMAIGLLLTHSHAHMTQWIYAATAGSFLYIAFADLVPAMSGEGDHDLKSVLIQISGFVVGGVIMLLIALNEEDLEVLFQ